MSKESNFYRSLKERIHAWIREHEGQFNKYFDVLMVVPDFFYLLWKLGMDERVAKEDRIKIGMLAAYFISPLDLFPELVFGPLGFLDDVIITAHLMNRLMEDYRDIIYGYWEQVSNEDLLETIHMILSNIDEWIGSNLWNRLRRRFSL